jgi:hypothetical protein
MVLPSVCAAFILNLFHCDVAAYQVFTFFARIC